MTKTLNRMDTEGTYLNIIKLIYGKAIANIILNSEKLKSFTSKIKNKTRLPTLPTFTQHGIGSPSQSN